MSEKKSEQNWLDVVPTIKDGIGAECNEHGLVSVLVPRFNKAWMAKLFLPKNKKNEIRINLDENGTRVWNLIDGRRDIKTILSLLSDVVSTEENYSDRVILFLQGLYKNGFIRLYAPAHS